MSIPTTGPRPPHYLRVVRALSLAALASGCTGAPPEVPVAPDSGQMADASVPEPHGGDAASPDAGVDVDADLPFSSGPMAPPELPESLA